MRRVLMTNFSRFWDPRTRVQFEPVLDRRTDTFVGVAEVDEAQAQHYASREGFEVLTDEQYLALTTRAQPAAVATPDDPLADPYGDPADPLAGGTAAAGGKGKRSTGGPPPPPPSSK